MDRIQKIKCLLVYLMALILVTGILTMQQPGAGRSRHGLSRPGMKPNRTDMN